MCAVARYQEFKSPNQSFSVYNIFSPLFSLIFNHAIAELLLLGIFMVIIYIFNFVIM